MINRPLSKEDGERLARQLRVLADPARLRLLALMAARDEARVRDVTAALGLSQPTVSHHIGVLLSAGLLEKRRRGGVVHYRLAADPCQWLWEVLSHGDKNTTLSSRRGPDLGKGVTPLPTVPSPSSATDVSSGYRAHLEAGQQQRDA
jgi:ArsR family transcriptional regulator, arsenate/arsenite/antimonite-responsive transcriptional repressor